MDNKVIEVSLADSRNIFIDKDKYGKCENKDVAANNEISRRRFKVTKVGDNKMELDLVDGRNIYI
jgi:hypothetical protein